MDNQQENVRKRKIATVVTAVMAIADALDTDSEEEKEPPRKLPKSRAYFNLVDEMDEEEFLTHFRVSRGMTKNVQ